jgi:predicted RNA-binding protein with PUA-like domain
VEVCFDQAFAELLPIEKIRGDKKLADLALLKRGQRLSIQPVTPAQFARILQLAGAKLK